MQALKVSKESHHEIHLFSHMEGDTCMSSSSLYVCVRGLASVYLDLQSGFSSTLVGHSQIVVALDHSSFLVVVSCQVAHKKWTSIVSIGGSLAIVVYVQGKPFFSTLWNAMLPRWDHTQDKSYVHFLLDQKSIHMSKSHSPSTKACYVA